MGFSPSRRPRWDGLQPRRRTPDDAVGDFAEVRQGFTLEEAIAEADRCLQCAAPACQEGCPNGNPIREFLYHLSEGRPEEAFRVDYGNNPLPACTGRVCAWERQCEGMCVMGLRGDPIRIGALERFIADWAAAQGIVPELAPAEDEGDEAKEDRRPAVAVVGAGPAGLAAAHRLTQLDYRVDVFDGEEEPGGVMSYGIPEFVLPQRVIDAEVERLEKLGVRFHLGVTVTADTFPLERFWEMGFDAVFIGIGANRPRGLNIPGAHLPGVWDSKSFLAQAAKAARDPDAAPPEVGTDVAIIGAGNTAMDAARTARRLGAERVTVYYRRSREDSPSRPIEMEEAEAEGVTFQFMVSPVALLGDDRVEMLRLQHMRPGPPDDSGRARPEPIPGKVTDVPTQTVVLCIGYDVDETPLAGPDFRLRRTPWGTIDVDPDTGRTSQPRVYAAGDCVTGPQTVVHAIAGARRAAESIDADLRGLRPAAAVAAVS